MRLASFSLLALLVAGPAFAQQLSPLTGTTAGTPSVAPAAPATGAAPAAGTGTARHRGHHARRTLTQRFEAANTSHDGKLTLEQAKAANFNRVAQHFDAMDTAKKGYVTMDDIHAYNRAQRAARKAAAKP